MGFSFHLAWVFVALMLIWRYDSASTQETAGATCHTAVFKRFVSGHTTYTTCAIEAKGK